MKLKHQTILLLSALFWAGMGIFLLYKGLEFISGAAASPLLGQKSNYPILAYLVQYVGSIETSAISLIVFALMLGTLKSRMVFTKAINKMIVRIRSFPDPASFIDVYGYKYLLLIALMMSFGFAMKYFNVPEDVRGIVDVAVGSALINGSLVYLRQVYAAKYA